MRADRSTRKPSQLSGPIESSARSDDPSPPRRHRGVGSTTSPSASTIDQIPGPWFPSRAP